MTRRVILGAAAIVCAALASRAVAQGPRTAATAQSAGAAASTGAAAAGPLSTPTGVVPGAFLGSVPSEPAQPGLLPLTLADAIERALHSNLGVLTVEHQIDTARAARWRSYGGVLPNFQARATGTREVVNLAAFGFDLSAIDFPGAPAFPSLVGPFNVVDGRLVLSQPLLDLSAWNDVRRTGHNLSSAELDSRNARETVVLVVVELYLRAVAGINRVEVANTQVETAQALLDLAHDQRDAGVVSGIDVLRAEVQLESQRQRLIAAETAYEKDKIALARAIGLEAEQDLELVDHASTDVPPAPSIDEAIASALTTRADYQAVLERLKAAEADRRGARAGALPSLHLAADLGEIGETANDAERTYTVAGLVRIPLFDAGRQHSRVIETTATLSQRQAEAADYEQRVEAEVRNAFLDLEATQRQLEVARSLVDLADRELAQARIRFSAGVTNNLEVIDAQESVATASDSYILSLHAYNLARVALARASGSAQDTAAHLLGPSS
jgi:outer membrane protein TolC